MQPIRFDKYSDLTAHCFKETKCKPFSSAGICPRPAFETCILRSVDGTEYYDDEMTDVENPQYTLFGHYGDQDPNEKRFNKKLLDSNITKHVYLYRVVYERNKSIHWLWYGEYKIKNTYQKDHPGKDGQMRKIIMLNLVRV